MDRPFRAPHAVAARAIERIDNPDPLLAYSNQIIVTLFGQHSVVGPIRRELLN